ncbi:DUF1003 domain-containing protein [Microlunatus lacustris]
MARAERASQRLNTPGARRRFALPRVTMDRDRFGQFAEGFARFMGTARFLAWMSMIVIVWVLWNVPAGPERPQFDLYPFIFLTLILSLQASYAAPLILLAQYRQEARDRVGLDADREQAAQSRADMDFLAREIASLRNSVGELATRDYVRSELRSELRTMLAELDTAAEEGRDGASSRLGSPSSADRRER